MLYIIIIIIIILLTMVSYQLLLDIFVVCLRTVDNKVYFLKLDSI